MKTKMILAKITLTAALALGAVAVTAGRGEDQENDRTHGSGYSALSNERFAQRIAGSYLGDFQDGSRMLLKLDLGGGTHRETSDDFIGLSGLPELPYHFYGGGFGNWTRTGRRTIRLVELAFQFGSDGLVSAITKNRVEIQFDSNLQSATAAAVVEVYLPTQDPLTEPAAFPGPTFEGITFRKIQ